MCSMRHLTICDSCMTLFSSRDFFSDDTSDFPPCPVCGSSVRVIEVEAFLLQKGTSPKRECRRGASMASSSLLAGGTTGYDGHERARLLPPTLRRFSRG